MTQATINLENLIKGNPASKKQEALGYAKESAIRELAEKYGVKWTSKSDVIVALSLAIE